MFIIKNQHKVPNSNNFNQKHIGMSQLYFFTLLRKKKLNNFE